MPFVDHFIEVLALPVTVIYEDLGIRILLGYVWDLKFSFVLGARAAASGSFALPGAWDLQAAAFLAVVHHACPNAAVSL